MSIIKVAILGFGTVGEGVYKTIQSHQKELTAHLGKKVEVAAVLIRNKQKIRAISDDVLVTTEFDEILRLPDLHIIMEAIVQQEPSFTYLKKAIKRGCHIITANKEMFAHHGKELLQLAEEHHVSIGFEATVAGGIPIIQTLRNLLKVNRIQSVQGILNGTSNFILTEMREKQQPFASALKLAQQNGYAEADPTNDVEGIDPFYKLMILSKIAFGKEPDWKKVELEGITNITSERMEIAASLGLRFKHIASISQKGGIITGSVKPVLIGKTHPFYHVEGVENAVNVQSDIVGSITLQGPGAGMFPTASAMIEDLVYVIQNSTKNRKEFSATVCTDQETKPLKELWLVDGIKNRMIHPAVTLVHEPAEGTWIIKATNQEMKHLKEQNQTICCFRILGDIDPRYDRLDSLTLSV